MGDFHAKTGESLIKELNSSKKGLSNHEAKKRLAKFGSNEIKEITGLRPFKILLEQFRSFLIYILIFAIIISFLIGHVLDATVILVIVILNATIGFFQQYKAEKAIISLRKLLVPTSIVIRDGKHISINSEELVPGDLIIFSAGDKVNADCRIIEEMNLEANEAILTGESMPISKDEKTLSEKTILAERINMLYTGTQIVRGSGIGLVVATGMNTEFGKIAGKLQGIEVQKTPMQKKLDRFSKQIGLIVLGMVFIVMFLGIFRHFDKVQMFLTAVALAVSAIPEGLPAVLAISFAISSLLMSKKNVIIRKLPAVESLGSVTVICTDKTGTLTEEKMNVQEMYSNDNLYRLKGKHLFLKNKKTDIQNEKELLQLVKTAVLCNNARFEETENGFSFIGDPTEEALVRLALDLKLNKKKLTEKEPRLKEFEFDSNRKMMSILRDSGRNNTLYTKGAPEIILERSSFELLNGEIVNLTPKRKEKLLEDSSNLQEDALRVLGFAYKQFSKDANAEEKSLIFLGFVGMIDPPRKEVRNAIQQTISAGINVKMITGDSFLTAKAIAMQIGIKGKIITGQELEKMSDEKLSDLINEISIFARTTPEQKLRIIQILQKKGEIVAVTGDGVNDVLALKSADIGIAMGIRGTDVARDVSDVVLIDDNFASIVNGIIEGRKTYDNIKKTTKFLLAVNFNEIAFILLTLLMGLPLPLLPLQILWMNLITDSLPALALVFEKPEDVMNTKPRKEKSILSGIWIFILIGGFLALAIGIFIYFFYFNLVPLDKLRTMVLTADILFELFFVYACRSKKPLLKIGTFSNKWLNYAILISIILHILLLYTPISAVFGVVPLTLKEWLLILPISISGLIILEIAKYIKTKKGNILEDGIND